MSLRPQPRSSYSDHEATVMILLNVRYALPLRVTVAQGYYNDYNTMIRNRINSRKRFRIVAVGSDGNSYGKDVTVLYLISHSDKKVTVFVFKKASSR
eukprot:g27046.t1